MEEYRQWLEEQIERCLNDKDLQREHWAFCKAYEKFIALRQPPVISSLPSDCYIKKKIGCHCVDRCEYEECLRGNDL